MSGRRMTKLPAGDINAPDIAMMAAAVITAIDNASPVPAHGAEFVDAKNGEKDSVTLARSAAAGDMSAEVVVWIQTGLCRHLNGEPLDRALQLDRVSLIRQRDHAMHEAAVLLAVDGRLNWNVAGQLAAAIRRFESRVYPRYRAGSAGDLSPLDRALLRAFETGQRITRTQRKLYEFLSLY